MTHEATPSDSYPNLGERLPELRFVADQEVYEQQGDLLLAAAEGINDVMTLMGQADGFNADLLSQGQAFSDLQIGYSNNRGQVEEEPFIRMLYGAGLMKPEEPVFMLTSKDLVAPGTNFVFGVTDKRLGISLQSTHRFMQGITDPNTRRLTIRQVARHEYGHLIGLDASTIKKQDKRGGIAHGHCVNDCTMQQAMNVPEAAVLSVRLATKPCAGFCADCTGFLRGRITALHR